MGRSWFYPDGYYPAKANNPKPWDPDANPYPYLVQYKGKVYARTNRWQGGRGAPDDELDDKGFRTWTLYSSNQQKFRWGVYPVALHTAVVKPVQPPKQDDIIDQTTYGVGSSALYFSEQSGDYFSIIPGVNEFTPSGIYDQLEDVWNKYRDETFDVDDAFTYIGPSYISDSPRWTQFHNEDDTVKMQTFTLCDYNGQNCVDVEVPAVPGFYKDQFPGGADFINYTPGSDAERLVLGYGNYVLGTQGSRPKPVIPPDIEIRIPGRILVSSRHFIGRQFTGYVVAVRQQYQWIGDATVPQGQVPDEVNGHFDAYPPIITGFTPEGKATPQTPIPFTFSQYPISYTIKNEDWLYHPEHRPIEPEDDIVIKIPQQIDEGVFIYPGVILTSITPGASV